MTDPPCRRPPLERIHGDNLRPERLLKAALRRRRVDFICNSRWLAGRPDVVLPASGLAVFVDGCFWRRCPRHWRLPKSHSERWLAKAERNEERDLVVGEELRAAGWEVMRVWEHDLTSERKADQVAASVLTVVRRLRRRHGRRWAMPGRDDGQLPLGT